ncbi:hypothetical protein JYT31_00695 [Beggiatoa alba]|nr:hypothetical protein [Beggiatoa alba]
MATPFSNSTVEHSDSVGLSQQDKLFNKHLKTTKNHYADFVQCNFANNLMQQTSLTANEIVLAAGYKSVNHCNSFLHKIINQDTTRISRMKKNNDTPLTLELYYRPPYNWIKMHKFLLMRSINGLEWIDENSYGRTFIWGKCSGKFTARHIAKYNRFNVKIEIDDISQLRPVIQNIRRILDLDTDSSVVENRLTAGLNAMGINDFKMIPGLRVPGVWSTFEAGIRAILGQQISVTAACKLVTKVVHTLGNKCTNGDIYFPSESDIFQSDFDFLKIPERRKKTLSDFGQYYLDSKYSHNPDDFLAINGIGPWTVDYIKLRGQSNPDIYLGGDLVIKKVVQDLVDTDKRHKKIRFLPDKLSPFRSYFTFQLWNLLS